MPAGQHWQAPHRQYSHNSIYRAAWCAPLRSAALIWSTTNSPWKLGHDSSTMLVSCAHPAPLSWNSGSRRSSFTRNCSDAWLTNTFCRWRCCRLRNLHTKGVSFRCAISGAVCRSGRSFPLMCRRRVSRVSTQWWRLHTEETVVLVNWKSRKVKMCCSSSSGRRSWK